MKKFSAKLKELATEIICYDKKDMWSLTKKEEKLCKKQNFCHTCKQKFDEEFNEDKIYCIVVITAITQVNIGGCSWYL